VEEQRSATSLGVAQPTVASCSSIENHYFDFFGEYRAYPPMSDEPPTDRDTKIAQLLDDRG